MHASKSQVLPAVVFMEDTHAATPAGDLNNYNLLPLYSVNIQTSQTLTVSCTVVRFKVFVQISILLIPTVRSKANLKLLLSAIIPKSHCENP